MSSTPETKVQEEFTGDAESNVKQEFATNSNEYEESNVKQEFATNSNEYEESNVNQKFNVREESESNVREEFVVNQEPNDMLAHFNFEVGRQLEDVCYKSEEKFSAQELVVFESYVQTVAKHANIRFFKDHAEASLKHLKVSKASREDINAAQNTFNSLSKALEDVEELLNIRSAKFSKFSDEKLLFMVNYVQNQDFYNSSNLFEEMRQLNKLKVLNLFEEMRQLNKLHLTNSVSRFFYRQTRFESEYALKTIKKHDLAFNESFVNIFPWFPALKKFYINNNAIYIKNEEVISDINMRMNKHSLFKIFQNVHNIQEKRFCVKLSKPGCENYYLNKHFEYAFKLKRAQKAVNTYDNLFNRELASVTQLKSELDTDITFIKNNLNNPLLSTKQIKELDSQYYFLVLKKNLIHLAFLKNSNLYLTRSQHALKKTYKYEIKNNCIKSFLNFLNISDSDIQAFEKNNQGTIDYFDKKFSPKVKYKRSVLDIEDDDLGYDSDSATDSEMED